MGNQFEPECCFTFPILLGFIQKVARVADLTAREPLFRLYEPVLRTVKVGNSR